MSLEKLMAGAREEIGGNTVVYAVDNPLCRVASYALNVPFKALFLSTKIGALPREEAQKAVKAYLETSDLESAVVRMGHSRVGEDLKRLFFDKNVRKSRSFIGRLLFGLPRTLLGSLATKLLRLDDYNPFTNTVHIYSNVQALARKQLARAKFFQDKKMPTLHALAGYVPHLNIHQDYKVGRIAREAAPENERSQTGRYLVPDYALGLGALASAGLLAAGLTSAGLLAIPVAVAAGHILGNGYNAGKATYNGSKAVWAKTKAGYKVMQDKSRKFEEAVAKPFKKAADVARKVYKGKPSDESIAKTKKALEKFKDYINKPDPSPVLSPA